MSNSIINNVKPRPILVFALVIFSLLFPIYIPNTHAAGNTYYVSTSGNDANSCTQAQNISTPKRTITAGANCLSSGGSLFLRAGTYADAAFGPNNVIIPNGMPGAPTTIKGVVGESVIIRPTTCSVQGDAVSLYGSNYITFQNLIIDATNCNTVGRQGIRLGDAPPTPTHHITFDGVEVKNAPGNCIGIQSNSGYSNTFNNLILHDCGTPGSNQDHGIYVRGDNNIIQNTLIYNIRGGYCVHMYDSGGSSDNNLFTGITAYNCGSAGAVIGGGTGNKIYNSIFYNSGNDFSQGGIQVGYSPVSQTKIYNNTIYNNKGYCLDIKSGASGTDAQNNICYQNTLNSIANSGSNSVLFNNFTTDPKFVNAVANDYHLQSTSPAIDAGSTLSAVPTDFDGVSRPQGSAYDIGAYEYGGVISTPTPTPSATPTPIPSFSKCDQNHDFSINVLDLQSLANVILGKTTCTPSTSSGSADYTCDLNQDSSVNVLDLQYLANVILGKNSCQ